MLDAKSLCLYEVPAYIGAIFLLARDNCDSCWLSRKAERQNG